MIERDGITISTIEHLMAALYALQVDDLRIELDGAEVPILDGSSRPFVDMVLEAGRVELPLEIDAGVPDDCVRIPAGVPGTGMLGGQFAAVMLEKG